MQPTLLKDGYKVGHVFQYHPTTTKIYANFTPRQSRVDGENHIIWFGLQYFIRRYLIEEFEQSFFSRPLDDVIREYRRRITNYLGPTPDDHIAALHRLQYLPLRIKSLPEGAKVPIRVPTMTIVNTVDEFFWLPNMLETLMSSVLWPMSTSATTAYGYRRRFERAAEATGGDPAFVKWQGHDFSMRGLMGPEAASMSGAGHLLSFTGTDTIPAIDLLERYYYANAEKELIGGSVPATEHSVMSMGLHRGEQEVIRRLIEDVYPAGIVSLVSDTWDLWELLTNYVPALRETILKRDGKVVFRPDSGTPHLILNGDPSSDRPAVQAGVVRILADIFGTTQTSKGFKLLNPHVGTIYGDSISPTEQVRILAGLAANDFASTNVVLGIGSYTYQHVTRDTYGWAMKSTWGVENGKAMPIFKKPATDNGTKNSAKGLLAVVEEDGTYKLLEDVSESVEQTGALRPVFVDGKLLNKQSLASIRSIVDANIQKEL